MVSSKAKGNQFERWVARKLSGWATDGEDPKQLVRADTQRLGVPVGEVGSDGWANVGDIAPAGPEGRRFRKHFGVECKHHKEIDWWWLWSHEAFMVLEWWNKIVHECEPHGLVPLLVITANYRPVVVGVPDSFSIPLISLSCNREVRFYEFDKLFIARPEMMYNRCDKFFGRI